MDPKSLSNLDPKLRETYERVMGTQGTALANPGTSTVPSATTNPPPAASSSEAGSPPSADMFAVNPIPPPSPTASAGSSPAIDTSALATSVQPNQAADLAALQPTLAGAPSPVSQEPVAELSKPPQPLPSPASINQAVKTNASPSPIIRVLYFIAGIIFFVVYAFFWLKIFNYPLPF